jgi:hypothetical protein
MFQPSGTSESSVDGGYQDITCGSAIIGKPQKSIGSHKTLLD